MAKIPSGDIDLIGLRSPPTETRNPSDNSIKSNGRQSPQTEGTRILDDIVNSSGPISLRPTRGKRHAIRQRKFDLRKRTLATIAKRRKFT